MSFPKKFFRFLTCVMVLSFILFLAAPASAAGREEQLKQKIADIVAGIPSSVVTDAEKSLYLHDYVVQNVAYEMVGEHQSAYGALLDGKAVCAGYADAYKRLLNAVGIEAKTITGYAVDKNGEQERHAWTMLVIDGKCLFTDVTWDDPFINGVQSTDHISHDYFHITLEQISKDHIPDEECKKMLPSVCNHTGYDFYSIHQGEGSGYGIFTPSTTPEDAVKYFRYLGQADGKDQFICEFRFDGDGIAWVKENWIAVAKQLGLIGNLSVSYQVGGYAVIMTVSGTLVNQVNVASVSLDYTKITLTSEGETVQLTATVYPENATNKNVSFVSSNPSVASVSANGLVTAVSNGSAIITVITADGAKNASCTITVSIPQPITPPPATEPTAPPATEPTAPSATFPPETQATSPSETGSASDPETEPTEPTSTQPPTEPADTSDPTDPTLPCDPSEPMETGAPQETMDPTNPGSSAEDNTLTEVPADAKDATSDAQNKPETDSNQAPVYISIACLVGLVLLLTLLRRKKHR